MTTPRPTRVAVASGLLVADAVLCALSVDLLFRLSTSGKGWVLPFQPGVWLIALLQVWAAVALLRRVSWVRYLLAVLFVLVLGDSLLSSSWPQRFANYPAATVRDALSYALQLGALLLLFSPSAARWFSHAPASPSAA